MDQVIVLKKIGGGYAVDFPVDMETSLAEHAARLLDIRDKKGNLLFEDYRVASRSDVPARDGREAWAEELF